LTLGLRCKIKKTKIFKKRLNTKKKKKRKKEKNWGWSSHSLLAGIEVAEINQCPLGVQPRDG
jgi:hypothetical protein